MTDTQAVETESPAQETPPPSESTPDISGSPPPETEGGGTLGEGGGSEEEAQATATWPADWRARFAGGNEKHAEQLQRFPDPSMVWKSYLAAQQKISGGEVQQAKPKGDPEDRAYQQALDEWRVQSGIPTKPEGYLENVPDGVIVGEADKDRVDSFLGDMHAIDAPPEFVHKALGWYYNLQEQEMAQRVEDDAANRMTAEDTLHAEWGNEYRPNLNAIHNTFAQFGDEGLLEEFFAARMADGTPLGDHVGTLKFLAHLSRTLNPHATITPIEGKTASQTVAAEIKELEAMQADTKGPYYHGPNAEAHQARYRELLDLEDRYKKTG